LANVLLRCGPFHILKAAYAAIGCLYEGSGLDAVAEEINYAKGTVVEMLKGNAFTRAKRFCQITADALSSSVMATVLDSFSDSDKEIIRTAAREGMSQDHTAMSADAIGVLKRVDGAFQREMTLKAESECKTVKLWSQFVTIVDIINRFEYAERTSDFQLHCKALAQLLPFLCAAGRYNYYPTISVYLSEMMQLEKTHPQVYEDYMQGHHAPRPTNQFWGGKETDLFCEEMMRVRGAWQPMHACTSVVNL
jgi:hypothetical protein